MSLYTDLANASSSPPTWAHPAMTGDMYIPSCGRPRHSVTERSEVETYTSTVVDPTKQADNTRFYEIYRATAAEQPVSVADLYRINIRLAQLEARRFHLTGWGVANVVLIADIFATADKFKRALEPVFAALRSGDLFDSDRARRKLYPLLAGSSMAWAKVRSVRRKVVASLMLETGHLGEQDGRAFVRALVPGARVVVVTMDAREYERRRREWM